MCKVWQIDIWNVFRESAKTIRRVEQQNLATESIEDNIMVEVALIVDCCKRMILGLAVCAVGVCLGAELPKTVPAWRNTVDKAAAEESMCAYTSNVIRCEWAGENPKIAGLMPANLGFQFAVIGDSDVTNRVQKILNEVADSFKPELRENLEKHGLLNPTLQWLVRSCRPGVTNWQEYIKPQNHPAAFKESDFDADRLKYFASRLKQNQIPMPVTVTLQYVDEITPLGKAEPGVDYPDILPEETFTLPFGCAIVPRALERRRKIRVKAITWPHCKATEYIWRVAWDYRILPWLSDGFSTPANGFADIVYDVASCNPRMDICIFAKFGDNLYGPPTIISLFRPSYDRRKYGKKGLESITYQKSSKNVPYDISPIWIPREWTDVFELNDRGQIVSFERVFPGCIKGEKFSAIGECVHSMSASGYPLTTSKVEYYISPDSGNLEYHEVGEEIHYRLGQSPSRRSGE